MQSVGGSGGASLLAVPIGEQCAFLRDTIDVRCLVAYHAVPVGADVRLADVIPHMIRMFGFFACAKEVAVETARVTAASAVTVNFVFISVGLLMLGVLLYRMKKEVTQRTEILGLRELR